MTCNRLTITNNSDKGYPPIRIQHGQEPEYLIVLGDGESVTLPLTHTSGNTPALVTRKYDVERDGEYFVDNDKVVIADAYIDFKPDY